MSNTDFSVSTPTFVQFEWNGWPEEGKRQLEKAVIALPSVTKFNHAGANSSFHVHFDPSAISQDDLISLVNQIAEPIVAKLKGPSMEGESSTATESPADKAMSELEVGNLPKAEPSFGSPNFEVLGDVSNVETSSTVVLTQKPIRSSSWTGRQSLPEQIATIRAYASLALAGLDALAAAIEDKRYNDDATLDALRTLKELRSAIDDLIRASEAGQPLGALWDSIERKAHDLIEAAKTGAKVIVAAPIMGVGAAYAISLLTGEPITGQMVATLAGGGIVAGAMAKNDSKP